ncbi:MAG TPA: GNAT family N-acetyltransferase [Acidimicrobiales bacterium]|nr:GNAT family N-acetyltransferase [Acidimicrobiales bacterium]
MRVQVAVRPWRDSDMAAALAVLRATHEQDAYPVLWPDEPSEFAAPPDVLEAWAAVGPDDNFVGHVCTRPPHGPPLAVWETGTGRRAEDLGVVSRLYVAPAARRLGVARLLLATAVDAIRRRGGLPVLDVLTRYQPAVALYETSGWSHLGSFVWPMPDGSEEPSYAYALLDGGAVWASRHLHRGPDEDIGGLTKNTHRTPP